MEVNLFCVKAEKARIATIQDTVNHALDQFERTFGRAYILGITDVAVSYGDACTIGILLLRLDHTHNHGVANLLPSAARDIFKANDAESVCAIKELFIGAL